MTAPRSEAARLLGSRLRVHRVALGISQQDAAALCEVDLANYGRLERGDANPTLETIVHVCATLQIDPAELLAGLAPVKREPKRRKYTVGEFLREKERARGTQRSSAD